MRRIDRRVCDMAARQDGVFTDAQAREAGASRSAIRHRIRTARWIRARPGVLRLPGNPVTWHQKLHAAVLADGPHAAAGRSAGVLHRLPGYRPGPIDVVRVRAKHRARHRESNHLLDAVCRRDGTPVLSVAATILSLASIVPSKRLERTVDNALAMEIVTIDELLAQLGHGRAGSALLRSIVEDRLDNYVAPAGEFAKRMLELIDEYRLGEPRREVSLGDDDGLIGRFDLFYEEERLVVEQDSRRHHMSKLDFENDRERDGRLAGIQCRVVRVTWKKLVTDRVGTAKLIRNALGW